MAPGRPRKKRSDTIPDDRDEEIDFGDGSEDMAPTDHSQEDTGSTRDFSVPPPSPPTNQAPLPPLDDPAPTSHTADDDTADNTPPVSAIPASSARDMAGQTSASLDRLRPRASTSGASPSSSPRKALKGKGKEKESRQKDMEAGKDAPIPPSPFPPNCPLIPPTHKETGATSIRRTDNNLLTLYNRSSHLERHLHDLRIPSTEYARSLSGIAKSLEPVG
ncbi:hypothetical protein VKT23_010541 [Stygiomarasmius scandens]|uniref:Uncharacterized protein n=1 Tax=Marasmiellus scandens TaxID=2682957 RepID=A0ABR1JCT5_9AGAR